MCADRLLTSDSFTGDLTVILEDNFQVKIPNHQLLVPERYITDKGDLGVNSSQPVFRINSLQDTTAQVLPVLGRYFLTSAYVFANRDANEFTLWQANPTTDENLVSVNKTNGIVSAARSCAVTPTTSLRPDSGGDQDGKQGEKGEGSSNASPLSSGALAGIVVGAIAGVGIGGGLLWWLLKQKRRSPATVEMDGPTEERERPLSSKATEVGWPSQGYPHFIPQEVSSQSVRMEPVELATGTETR